MSKFVYDEDIQDGIGRQVLFVVAPIIGIWSFFADLANVWFDPSEYLRALSGFMLFFFVCVSWLLGRLGWVRAGMNVLGLGFLGACVVGMYFNAGVCSSFYTGSLCMLAFAVWYYERGIALGVWAFLVGLGAVFLALERYGMLPLADPPVLSRRYLILAAQLTFILFACMPPARMLHTQLYLRKRKQEEMEALVEQLRQQKRTLAQRELESRETQHIAKVGSWTRDMETGALTCSAELFAIAGVERQPATMEMLLRSVHPEDRNLFFERGTAPEGPFHETEFRFVLGNGAIRWIHSKWWSEFDAEGREILRHGVSQDITYRKHTEHLLEIEAQLSRALLETDDLESVARVCVASAISASGMDCGGIYIKEENGALRLVYNQGVTPAFTESRRNMPEDHPVVLTLRQGKPIYMQYSQLVPEMDEIERLEILRACSIIPILHRGRVIGTLNIASHATDDIPKVARQALEIVANQIGGAIMRAKAHDALEKSETRFRQLVETSNDIIWEMDATGRAVYASPRIREVLGYSPEEALALRGEDLIEAKSLERARNVMETAARTGKGWRNLLYQWRHKDGSVRWLESNGEVVFDGAGNVVAFRGSDRDVTARVLSEAGNGPAQAGVLKSPAVRKGNDDEINV